MPSLSNELSIRATTSKSGRAMDHYPDECSLFRPYLVEEFNRVCHDKQIFKVKPVPQQKLEPS